MRVSKRHSLKSKSSRRRIGPPSRWNASSASQCCDTRHWVSFQLRDHPCKEPTLQCIACNDATNSADYSKIHADGLAVLPVRQSAQRRHVDGDRDGPDAAVTQNKLTHAGMIAAKRSAAARPLGERCADTGLHV